MGNQKTQVWKVAVIDNEGLHTLGNTFSDEASAVAYVKKRNTNANGYPRYTHFDMKK